MKQTCKFQSGKCLHDDFKSYLIIHLKLVFLKFYYLFFFFVSIFVFTVCSVEKLSLKVGLVI